MTKQEKYQLAKWTLQQALKKGAQQASVSISNSRSSSVEVRESGKWRFENILPRYVLCKKNGNETHQRKSH